MICANATRIALIMNAKLLITAGIPIVGLLILVAGLGLAGREVSERTLEYRGERYTGRVLATQEEVDRTAAIATDDRVDGKQVFAERRRPSRVLFLLRPDGRYDAYVLARNVG
ncbi:MAG TPA: hypothetical protein VNT58_07370 [Gaiellaceae bacterium]|nr:hypothetical protein [Gaiellaceae bacterium]